MYVFTYFRYQIAIKRLELVFIGTQTDWKINSDEIQKLPELIDVVHTLIEKNKSQRFILTGSSARKFNKQGQNLLGGRAYPLSLHPITSQEFLSVATLKPIDLLIQIGGLPSVLTANSPQRVLKAYVGIYLQEEIKTVAAYYSILQDTLLGYLLEPFKETKSRKPYRNQSFIILMWGCVIFFQVVRVFQKELPNIAKP